MYSRSKCSDFLITLCFTFVCDILRGADTEKYEVLETSTYFTIGRWFERTYVSLSFLLPPTVFLSVSRSLCFPTTLLHAPSLSLPRLPSPSSLWPVCFMSCKILNSYSKIFLSLSLFNSFSHSDPCLSIIACCNKPHTFGGGVFAFKIKTSESV